MPPMANPAVSNPNPQARRGPKSSVSNQSLNHLLNFSLPPRQPHTNFPRRSSKKTTGNAYGARSTERFVNAQYRFVMKPSGDYTRHFTDPDVFFQWNDVLQVLVPRTSTIATAGSHRSDEGITTCPICLSPPTAARMTKCGHVFCFQCILHYLNISDIDKWIRCPICFDSVNEKQLKSVKWYDGHTSGSVADQQDCGQESGLDLNSPSKARRSLRMRLMQRPHITTLALPRSPTWPSDLVPSHQAPFHFLPDVYTFSKFMLATPEYLTADLQRDLDELEAERIMLQSMNDDLSILFVDAAESKVRTQIILAQEMDTELLRRAVDKAHRDLADIQRRDTGAKEALIRAIEKPQAHSSDDVPTELLSLNPPSGSASFPRTNTARVLKSRRNLNPPPPSSSTYYYYQSASGSPIFLHPLDIRILLSHFNSHTSFPNEITVEVEAFSEGSVNDDLRKRCKYLAFPDGADVAFVEANLESVVGTETMKNFEGAVKTRRIKRKEKTRRDDKAKIRAEETERDRIYGPAQWGDDAFSSLKMPDDWSSTGPIEVVSETQPTQNVVPETPQGAWGSRSFASALHSTSSARPPARIANREEVHDDEWDIDTAWHEMQQRGGGRKQGRSQKLVILGGGPNTGRRR
ncbi:hypothetical protein BU17DRAFT_81568 [Hysterangium stoloniferum]|nr:hypothetical protein BU17DRAFT_81568 [Hysterangium stoloniferum]